MEDLTYYYPDKEDISLNRVSLEVEEGEFIFLTGPSGCGKSSLLRALAGLLPDFYGGRVGGQVTYRGRPLDSWDKRQLAREVSLVLQDPEQQVVMTVVEQEIAFGLENLGVPPAEMRRRVAEVLALLDLSTLREGATFKLSGGQMQKVVLASALAMHPRVLLLDEPTSQLDPVAAQDLLNYVQRLNLEWGMTVILVEQRVDRCFHLADRVVIMEKGEVIHQAPPREMVRQAGDTYAPFVPPAARVLAGRSPGRVPLTIKEGRQVLREITGPPFPGDGERGPRPPPGGVNAPLPVNGDRGVPLLEIKNLGFAYPGKPPCLQHVNLKLFSGEIVVILGENGAGKSTLLKNVNGLLRPREGKVLLQGKEISGRRPGELALDIGYLSQDPGDYLFNDTVQEEIAYNLHARGEQGWPRVTRLMGMLGLQGLEQVNPRDLSGGERQRVALGTVLSTDPRILLLDEPTRGLDPLLKQGLGELLRSLQGQGKSLLVVTHDVEFAAGLARRVVIMSQGEIVADGEKAGLLSGSLYYSPQVNRLFRGLPGGTGIMTVEEGIEFLNAFYPGEKEPGGG